MPRLQVNVIQTNPQGLQSARQACTLRPAKKVQGLAVTSTPPGGFVENRLPADDDASLAFSSTDKTDLRRERWELSGPMSTRRARAGKFCSAAF